MRGSLCRMLHFSWSSVYELDLIESTLLPIRHGRGPGEDSDSDESDGGPAERRPARGAAPRTLSAACSSSSAPAIHAWACNLRCTQAEATLSIRSHEPSSQGGHETHVLGALRPYH